MRRATNRRVRIFLWLVLAGALIGAAYGGVVGRVFRETGLIGGSIRAIDGHGGEIYQYVGDEMVVTWPVSAGRTDARPLACFFAIEAAIEAAAGEFEREFGIVPRLRAALHAGPVIGGEIGDSKREIVFHGDVMNTAARLEQATRDLDRPFLVLAEAVGRLDGTEPYAREALGPRALRGREAPVEIYAVTAAR